MRAWSTTCDLVSTTCVGKHTDVYMLYVGSRDRERNYILRFASSRAGVTTDAACVVYYLRPLDRAG